MRVTLLVLFLTISFQICVNGQNITFNCYLKSNCTDTLKLLKYYTLIRSSNYYSVTDGQMTSLPDTGDYILKSSEIATDGDSITVHIGSGVNIDTIKQKDLIEVIQKPKVDDKRHVKKYFWTGWVSCGINSNKKCQGYNIDYYDNGKRRIEGNFRKGKPIGELKYYDSLGKVKYTEHYNKRGKFLRSSRL